MSPRKKAEDPLDQAPEETAIQPVENTDIEASTKTESDLRGEQMLELMSMDVGKLTLEQKAKYLMALARSFQMNPLLKPFDFIKTDDGRVIIYANRGCADQLADIRKLSTTVLYRGPMAVGQENGYPVYNNNIWMVVVEVKDQEGRVTHNVGASDLSKAQGTGLANAIMKTETKAIRRARLAHCGVGLPDVEELDSIPSVRFEGPRVVEPPALPQGTPVEVAVSAESAHTVPAPPLPAPKPPVRPPVVPPRPPKIA